DVDDVVSNSGPLFVAPLDRPAGQLFQAIEQFEDRRRILPASAEIVDLAWPGIVIERLERADDIFAVDLVADLLPFVSNDRVRFATGSDAHEIGQKAVKLDSAM